MPCWRWGRTNYVFDQGLVILPRKKAHANTPKDNCREQHPDTLIQVQVGLHGPAVWISSNLFPDQRARPSFSNSPSNVPDAFLLRIMLQRESAQALSPCFACIRSTSSKSSFKLQPPDQKAASASKYIPLSGTYITPVASRAYIEA